MIIFHWFTIDLPIQVVIFHRFLYVHQVKLTGLPLPGPSGQRTIGEGQSQIQGGREPAVPWEVQIMLLEMWVIHQKKWVTLWLCQNSYWKWPFIVDFSIEHGDFP